MEEFITVDTMNASNEIIDAKIKVQTLNIIRNEFEKMIELTSNKKYISIIKYNLTLLEDCYKIDMYKFQFKALVDILQKDIKNLKEALALSI